MTNHEGVEGQEGLETDALVQFDSLPSSTKEVVEYALNSENLPHYREQIQMLREDYDGDGPEISPEDEKEVAAKLRELATMEGSTQDLAEWATVNILPLIRY